MEIKWWEGESIRWFLDASRITGFHKTVAGAIIPFLEASDTLCDIGAGLGRLDLYLAPFCKIVSALDTNTGALDVLRQDTNNMGLKNTETIVCNADDVLALQREWDIIMMSFFGQLQSRFSVYKKISKKHIISIVNTVRKGELHPKEAADYNRPVVSDIEDFLKSNSIKYELINLEIEFGQPLKSIEDGVNFVRSFSKNISCKDAKDFIIKNTIKSCNEFPLYLPNKKPIGIFVI